MAAPPFDAGADHNKPADTCFNVTAIGPGILGTVEATSGLADSEPVGALAPNLGRAAVGPGPAPTAFLSTLAPSEYPLGSPAIG